MKIKLLFFVASSGMLLASESALPTIGQTTNQIKSLTDIPFASKSNAELIESKADFLRRHGVGALWLDDAAEAEKVKEMLLHNPTDADLSYIYGAYLLRQGRKVDAMVYLTAAAEGDPAMVLYQIEAARALVAMQGYAGAIRYFERANRLSYQNIHLLNDLGDAYAKAGKAAAARKAYSESLKIKANQPEIAEKLRSLAG